MRYSAAPPQQRQVAGPVEATPWAGRGLAITGRHTPDPYVYWGMGTVMVDEPGGLFWSIGYRWYGLFSGQPIPYPLDVGGTLWRVADGVPTPITSTSSGVAGDPARADFLGTGRRSAVVYAMPGTTPPFVRINQWKTPMQAHFYTTERYAVGSLRVEGETIVAGPVAEGDWLNTVVPDFEEFTVGGIFPVPATTAKGLPQGTFSTVTAADVAGLGEDLAMLMMLTRDDTHPGSFDLYQLAIAIFDPFAPAIPTQDLLVKHDLTALFGFDSTGRISGWRATRRSGGEAIISMSAAVNFLVQNPSYMMRVAANGVIAGVEQVDSGSAQFPTVGVNPAPTYMGADVAVTVRSFNDDLTRHMYRIDGEVSLLPNSALPSAVTVDLNDGNAPVRFDDDAYAHAHYDYANPARFVIENRAVTTDEVVADWTATLTETPDLSPVVAVMAEPTGRKYGQVDESCWAVGRPTTNPTGTEIVMVCAGGRGLSDQLQETVRYRRLPGGLTDG